MKKYQIFNAQSFAKKMCLFLAMLATCMALLVGVSGTISSTSKLSVDEKKKARVSDHLVKWSQFEFIQYFEFMPAEPE